MIRAGERRRSAPSRRSRPARRETRAVTEGGSTESRYSCGWCSNDLPGRHAHDAALDALLARAARGRPRTGRPRCPWPGGAPRACRPARRPGRRRPWPGRTPAAYFVRSRVGRACRRQDQADGLVAELQDHAPGLGHLVGVGGADRHEAGDGAQRERAARRAGASGPSSPTPIESWVKT